MRIRGMVLCMVVISFVAATVCQAGFFDDLSRGLGLSGAASSTLDDVTLVKGLKEALATGTKRAITTVGKTDGYFGNQAIRILMPEQIRGVADLLVQFGFNSQIDAFVLSMNRAAEKAAPKALDIIAAAVSEMSIADAGKILNGGDTAATEYLKRTTGERISAAFKPVVAASVDQVGASRNYKQMIKKYEGIPFVPAAQLDLDSYVTTKAVEGLFFMLAEEERKIRTDPAARGTALLRKVFGQ